MDNITYKNIKIIYEDNHLLVVDKPEGMLSQEDITKDLDILTLLKEYLKEKYNKKGDAYLGLVHRLDRRVSGVMVFGKTSKAASRLSECIRNKTFKKTYVAICSGHFEGSGVLKDNLKARAVYEKWGGVLDDYTQPIVKLGVGYDEVFYTYNI